jgi:hypothetical protein
MELTFLQSASEIVAKGLGDYINGAYIEFQRGTAAVTDLPDPASVTSEYYNSLRLNTLDNRDFLRVNSVIVSSKKTETGYQVVFQALITGTQGEGGQSALDSRIYGGALVYMPTKDTSIDDITRDIVFACGYFQPSEQMVITDSEQTAITFTLNL